MNCKNCDYFKMSTHENEHCYMFKDEPNPEEICMQFRSREQGLQAVYKTIFNISTKGK